MRAPWVVAAAAARRTWRGLALAGRGLFGTIDRAAALAGYGLLVAGVAQLSVPWSFIVAGGLLLAGVAWRRA